MSSVGFDPDFELDGEVDIDAALADAPELIYLVGPIGTPRTEAERQTLQERAAYAAYVEGQLVARGYLVHNPYSSTSCDSNFTSIPLGVWLATGALWVQRCDRLCLLRGWDQSTGCALELTLARAWGKAVSVWEDSVGLAEYPGQGA